MGVTELRVAPHEAATRPSQPTRRGLIVSSDKQPPIDLSAVGMPREHEIDSCAGGLADDGWVVAKKNSHLATIGLSKRGREIIPLDHQVIDSREPHSRSTAFEGDTLIGEHANPLVDESGTHHLTIRPMVVIAKNSEDSTRRAQRPKSASAAGDVISRM